MELIDLSIIELRRQNGSILFRVQATTPIILLLKLIIKASA